MRELTQTSFHPAGNCWQTCIACILDIDPAEMPPQEKYDWNYHSTVNWYLREHHNLAYVEIHLPEESLSILQIAPPGYHMLTGRTVRSDAQDGARHVVVGQYGKMVWDPHPSRAGLLEEIRWGLLIPFPKSWRDSSLNLDPCECPRCSASRGGPASSPA